ncbi:MAG: AAA family ATPase [Acidobacteriota bacterium]|nr:AAA family ATPase [Acidobacteriota bacterium]
MKLIFLYGAPAVGKLTVAQELAKLTGFRVFHNHLTIDCIEPVFDFGTPSFSRLINLIRLETVAEAARAHVNLIFTYCYAKDFDDAHVAEFAKTIEANGGEICFVLLTCERGELERRVLEESRKQYSKAQNTEILGEILGKYDLSSPVPQRESLLIDNTNLSAAEVAQKIVEHFRLN